MLQTGQTFYFNGSAVIKVNIRRELYQSSFILFSATLFDKIVKIFYISQFDIEGIEKPSLRNLRLWRIPFAARPTGA
jgi:hypothetical protein